MSEDRHQAYEPFKDLADPRAAEEALLRGGNEALKEELFRQELMEVYLEGGQELVRQRVQERDKAALVQAYGYRGEAGYREQLAEQRQRHAMPGTAPGGPQTPTPRAPEAERAPAPDAAARRQQAARNVGGLIGHMQRPQNGRYRYMRPQLPGGGAASGERVAAAGAEKLRETKTPPPPQAEREPQRPQPASPAGPEGAERVRPRAAQNVPRYPQAGGDVIGSARPREGGARVRVIPGERRVDEPPRRPRFIPHSVYGQWQGEATGVGGGTQRIGRNEAEQIFRRVEIRGDKKYINATPRLLERAGLTPRHRLAVEGRGIWFSRGFDVGDGREAVIGYVTTDENKIVARSYYRSRSSGSWRYLPQFRYDEGSGRADWYSKGYGEESLTLPSVLQEGLTRAIEDDGGVLQIDGKVAEAAFLGTARGLGSMGTVYHEQVSKRAQDSKGIPGGALRDGYRVGYPAPESVRIDVRKAPQFNRPLRAWQQTTDLYGRVTCEVFASADGRLGYTFCRDSRGRAWVSSIEDLASPVESTGLRTEWIDSVLTTPAYEYASQSGGYGNVSDRNGSYVDMFQNYLSRVPVIQQYLRSSRPRSRR
jgi:hypothetical protein